MHCLTTALLVTILLSSSAVNAALPKAKQQQQQQQQHADTAHAQLDIADHNAGMMPIVGLVDHPHRPVYPAYAAHLKPGRMDKEKDRRRGDMAAKKAKRAASSSSTSSRSTARTTASTTSRAVWPKISTSSSTTSHSHSSTSSKAASSTSAAAIARIVQATTSKPTATTTATPAPTVRASTCAPLLTKGPLTITGTGTLPKPTSFVKASGTTLSKDGAGYYIAGVNIYWLCQDENVPNVATGTATDKGRIREGLAIAVAMGANTVRLMSCGVSVGSSNSIESSRGTFGNWDVHDYVIYAAGQYGLRVILPLTDNYDYYHGGKYTFLRWRSLSLANFGGLFYSDANVIDDYLTYIKAFLSHINVYNGLAYGNDPTILAYETGNELGAYIGKEGYPPAAWTSTIAATIREYSHSLIIDGSDGFYNYSTKATAPGLNVLAIQIMSDHGYSRNIGLLQAQVPLAKDANKAFLIGEYDWTNDHGGVALPDYLAYMESVPSIIGDMIWNVMGHDDQCCNFITHGDGYSLYYPNGNSVPLQSNIAAVVQHLYRVTGRSSIANSISSTNLPVVACPQKVF